MVGLLLLGRMYSVTVILIDDHFLSYLTVIHQYSQTILSCLVNVNNDIVDDLYTDTCLLSLPNFLVALQSI